MTLPSLPRLLAPLLFASALFAGAAGAADFAVLQRSALGGPGGCDYLSLDAPAHRLYIARSDRVLVVNTETDQLVATIPGMDGAHGIALAPNWDRGFVSNGRGNSVTQFSLATLKPVR